VVGPDDHTKTFKVYRGLLCFQAKYFNGLLNSGFAEAGSNSIPLAEVDVHIFQVFSIWLNSGALDDLGALTTSSQWGNFIKAYTFADYYLAQNFRNALLVYICRTTFAALKMFPGCNRLVYDATSAHDPLRRWLVDVGIRTWTMECFTQLGSDDFHRDFLYDFIVATNAAGVVPGVVEAHFTGAHFTKWEQEHIEHFCERYPDHSSLEVYPLADSQER
jgi:hypothetical protein